jgi:hypothetical protein
MTFLKSRYKTRTELGNKVHQHPYSVFNEVMDELFKKEERVGSVGFHSDVYYIRALIEKREGVVLPLWVVHKAMKQEGKGNAYN